MSDHDTTRPIDSWDARRRKLVAAQSLGLPLPGDVRGGELARGRPITIASICIPTFDRPAGVRRTLESILAGSDGCDTAQVELVVTDNSSGEETARAVQPLLDRWPGPTHYTRNVPNIGMVANFNRCVELATSPWIMILHDDDYLVEGGLARLLAGLRDAEADDRAILFGVRVVNGEGRLLRRQLPKRRRRLEPDAALSRNLSRSSYIRFPAIVVHRDAYEAVGPFDDSVGGATDFDMWSRVLARFGLKLEPELTVTYVVHAEAATEQMFTEGYLLKICAIFDRAATYGVLPVTEVRRAQAHWLNQFVLAGAVRRLRRGDRASARKVLDLLEHENVRSLGASWRWLPVRLCLRAIAGRGSTWHRPGSHVANQR